jgi:hypothetical protein
MKKESKLKKFEEMCEPIVMEILKSEGFEVLKNANEEGPKYKWKFSNPPFDFLGYKSGEPYLIEFKGSLSSVHTPGETQKRRLQELLAKIYGLHVALLQIKLSSGKYRILIDGEMDKLFNGPQRSLDPVENWIREKIDEGIVLATR